MKCNFITNPLLPNVPMPSAASAHYFLRLSRDTKVDSGLLHHGCTCCKTKTGHCLQKSYESTLCFSRLAMAVTGKAVVRRKSAPQETVRPSQHNNSRHQLLRKHQRHLAVPEVEEGRHLTGATITTIMPTGPTRPQATTC